MTDMRMRAEGDYPGGQACHAAVPVWVLLGKKLQLQVVQWAAVRADPQP